MPGGTNEVMRDFFIRVIGNTPEERFIYVVRAQNAKAALNLHINNLGESPRSRGKKERNRAHLPEYGAAHPGLTSSEAGN